MDDFKMVNIFIQKYLRVKKFYSKDEVLLLDSTLYGLKQMAMGFWKELLKAHKHIGNGQNRADPC